MKLKTYTQEEIRLQICELLKDCSNDDFMKVTKVLMGDLNPNFSKEKCSSGFPLIEMLG